MMEEFDDQRSIQGIDDYWADRGSPQVVDSGAPLLWLADRVCLGLDHSGEIYLGEPGSGRASEGSQQPGRRPTWKSIWPTACRACKRRCSAAPACSVSFERFHLYPSDANSQDDQVKNMRDDIKMDLVRRPTNTGQAAGTGRLQDFLRCQRSCDRAESDIALTSFFVDENVRASQEQSEATTLFLDSQVRALGQALAEQEAKLRAFEAQHEGSLPQQLQSNIQILNGIQAQLQAARRLANAPSSSKPT